MKLSYFMMPLHTPAKPYAQQLAEDEAAVILADELGFEEVWVGEHYSSAVEQITSPLMFLASLIHRTKRIKLATGVVGLPHYHPAVVAGHAAMFDHLAGGRFIFGIGPGGLVSDFELLGEQDMERDAMTKESIQTILKLWASDDPPDIEGRFWTSRVKEWALPELGLGNMAKPLQQPHPPIGMSALSPYSGSMLFAGANGFLPVSANFVGLWNVKTHWQKYVEGAESAGRKADPSVWRVARSIYVGESEDEATDMVTEPDGAFDYYYRYLWTIFDRTGRKMACVPFKDDDPDTLTHQQMRDGLTMRGTVKQVTEQILALREELGPFGKLVLAAHDWQHEDRMRASMRRLANEVMPAVNKAIGEG